MISTDVQWSLSSSSSLATLAIYKELPIEKEKADLPKDSYEVVGWDGMKINKVDGKQLTTSELGPCFVLCARGYNAKNVITHTGMAHWFMNKEVPETFCKNMREEVGQGRIELYIGGGKNDQDGQARRVSILQAAKSHDIEVVHDVSLQFFRNLGVMVQDDQFIYRGSTGISHAWFDKEHQPHLRVNARTEGKDVDALIKEANEKGKSIKVMLI